MEICANCGSSNRRDETTDEIAERLNKSMETYHQSRGSHVDSYWRSLLESLNIKNNQ